jgi:hypothetical protein
MISMISGVQDDRNRCRWLSTKPSRLTLFSLLANCVSTSLNALRLGSGHQNVVSQLGGQADKLTKSADRGDGLVKNLGFVEATNPEILTFCDSVDRGGNGRLSADG